MNAWARTEGSPNGVIAATKAYPTRRRADFERIFIRRNRWRCSQLMQRRAAESDDVFECAQDAGR
jgi:hypothetical protein